MLYYNDSIKKKSEQHEFGVIFDLAGNQNRLQELESITTDPEFWNDQDKAQRIMREQRAIQQNIDLVQKLMDQEEEVDLYREMIKEDEDLSEELETLLEDYYKNVGDTEMMMMLSGKYDNNPALLTIHPGAGGTESQDWASMLYRMYTRYSERAGFKTEVLDYQDGEEAGIKGVTIRVDGDFAYGFLKAESGVHRLVRISPYDASKRRHTSFSSVHVIPEIEDDSEVEIDEKDLRIDTYRSSGAGGQHVNTTDSAIRITHLPTGIVTQCQNERSQHKNKATAMKVLRSKLVELQLEKMEQEVKDSSAAKKDVAFGSQIRSYVLHPYQMVKDLRTAAGEVEGVTDAGIPEISLQNVVRGTSPFRTHNVNSRWRAKLGIRWTF